MAVDLVVLLDDSLMASMVQNPMADVVGWGRDGHMVATVDSRSRCDEALK